MVKSGPGVTVRGMRERCRILEDTVRHRAWATADELDAFRPGGPENPRRDLLAWVRWYGQLIGFQYRADARLPASAESDAVVLDALRAAPKAVALTAVDPDTQTRRQVMVYPKSLDALLYCQTLDQQLAWLAEKYSLLHQVGTVDALELAERVAAEISVVYRWLVWTVTDPTPGVPFNWAAERPDPPAEFADLEPWDYVRVCQAFQYVNATRLQALEALITASTTPTKTGSQRPSWSVFIGALSVKMNRPPGELMRDVTLAELLVAVRLAGAAEASQRDAASPESEPEDGEMDGAILRHTVEV